MNKKNNDRELVFRVIDMSLLESLYTWFVSRYGKDQIDKGAEFVYKDLVITMFWNKENLLEEQDE